MVATTEWPDDGTLASGYIGDRGSHCPFGRERAKHEGEAVGGCHAGTVDDLEVKVREIRVSGIAEPADHLTLPDVLPNVDLQAPGLEMSIDGEVATSDVDHQMVAEEVLRSHGRYAAWWALFGKSIP